MKVVVLGVVLKNGDRLALEAVGRERARVVLYSGQGRGTTRNVLVEACEKQEAPRQFVTHLRRLDPGRRDVPDVEGILRTRKKAAEE